MPTVETLAELVGGTIIGDGDHIVTGIAALENAEPQHLSFLANSRYRSQAGKSRAGAILTASKLVESSANQILCDNPYKALACLASAFVGGARRPTSGVANSADVHPGAVVDPSASIGPMAIVEDGARIGPDSVIHSGAMVGGGAVVGMRSRLHPGAMLLWDCVLGDDSILHAGAVIGADGFGFAVDEAGKRHKVPQLGNVVIGDDVEIGANSTVDRATFGSTVIGSGCKIDNLVQIAHNVRLGEDCVITAQSGVAGSAVIGDRVVAGAQSGIAGHIEVGSDITLAARTGLSSNTAEPGVYAGFPSQPLSAWRRAAVSQKHGPDSRKRLLALEQRVASLASQLENHDDT